MINTGGMTDTHEVTALLLDSNRQALSDFRRVCYRHVFDAVVIGETLEYDLRILRESKWKSQVKSHLRCIQY